jgi:hypothetical protein
MPGSAAMSDWFDWFADAGWGLIPRPGISGAKAE